jgi:hypothetical protein
VGTEPCKPWNFGTVADEAVDVELGRDLGRVVVIVVG